MRVRDVDPKIRQLFPWALFLAGAVLLALAASCLRAESEEDIYACYGPARYQAMYSAWPSCTELCSEVKSYLQTHTKEEGLAAAQERHVPEWIIKKAEGCLK